MPEKTNEKTNKEYEIEDAARTLIRAEEIRKDKSLYEAALKKVKEQSQAATNVLSREDRIANAIKKMDKGANK